MYSAYPPAELAAQPKLIAKAHTLFDGLGPQQAEWKPGAPALIYIWVEAHPAAIPKKAKVSTTLALDADFVPVREAYQQHRRYYAGSARPLTNWTRRHERIFRQQERFAVWVRTPSDGRIHYNVTVAGEGLTQALSVAGELRLKVADGLPDAETLGQLLNRVAAFTVGPSEPMRLLRLRNGVPFGVRCFGVTGEDCIKGTGFPADQASIESVFPGDATRRGVVKDHAVPELLGRSGDHLIFRPGTVTDLVLMDPMRGTEDYKLLIFAPDEEQAIELTWIWNTSWLSSNGFLVPGRTETYAAGMGAKGFFLAQKPKNAMTLKVLPAPAIAKKSRPKGIELIDKMSFLPEGTRIAAEAPVILTYRAAGSKSVRIESGGASLARFDFDIPTWRRAVDAQASATGTFRFLAKVPANGELEFTLHVDGASHPQKLQWPMLPEAERPTNSQMADLLEQTPKDPAVGGRRMTRVFEKRDAEKVLVKERIAVVGVWPFEPATTTFDGRVTRTAMRLDLRRIKELSAAQQGLTWAQDLKDRASELVGIDPDGRYVIQVMSNHLKLFGPGGIKAWIDLKDQSVSRSDQAPLAFPNALKAITVEEKVLFSENDAPAFTTVTEQVWTNQ